MRLSTGLMAATVLASAGLWATVPTAASAKEATIRLPAQPLAQALRTIGSRTHTVVRFDPSIVGPLRSGPVEASTAAEAIREAIRGTSLTLTGTPENGFLVSGANVAISDQGDIVVVAKRDEAETRYLVATTASSTRDGNTLRDQPQATTVISQKLIADQQIQTVAQALRNAAGATVNLGNVQGAPSYTVRGFFATPLTGGLSDPAAGLSQPVANVERVEVLKGAAALLAGANNLGGSVNIVTKKPIAQPLLDFTVENGSFDDWRVILDASTALDPDKKFSARLITQYARADHNAGGYDGRFENLVAPSLRFKNGALDLTGGIEYSDVRAPAPAFGAFNYAGKLVDLSGSPVGPRNSGFRVEARRYYYDGTLKATSWLTLVSRSQVADTNTTLNIYGLAANLSPTNSLFLKTNEEQRSRATSTDNYARIKVRTGAIKQTISLGFNYSNYEIIDYVPANPTGSVVTGNFFGGATLPFTAFTFNNKLNYTSFSRQFGYYAQDLIEVGPVHLFGAVRENHFTSGTTIPGGSTSRNKQSSLTPQGGVVLDLTRRLSIYANYVQGFAPQFLLDRNGALLPPQHSRNIEAGAKWEILPDRLAFSASAFRIRQTNVPVAIPGLRNRYDIIAGEQAKGVEADLTGQILPGWDVALNYSYTDYVILDPVPASSVVPGQPKHKYSVFSRYTLPTGPLKNLGASIGVYGFSSSRLGRTATAFVLPPQTDVSANLYYKIWKIRANFGVDNLLDKKVYGISQVSSYVPINPTRTYRLTLTYSMF